MAAFRHGPRECPSSGPPWPGKRAPEASSKKNRDRGTIARSDGSREPPKPGCRVAAAQGGFVMLHDVSTTISTTPEPTAELDRLGDEIAELSAQLDAATAPLLELIREFDAGGGWNTGFRSCAAWLSWR